MGNPAAGILVLLLALWLLLAYFSGRLEWLFALRGATGSGGMVNGGTLRRPGSTAGG